MLFDVMQELDRIDSALSTALSGWGQAAPMNVRRESDRYVVDADLPGVDPKSIDVSVDGRWLTIRADRSTSSEWTEGEWLLKERSDASVVRSMALGQDVDVDGIRADYRDGVLTVVMPIVENARPKRIAVTAGTVAESAAITAGASEASSRPEAVSEGKAQPAHSHAA